MALPLCSLGPGSFWQRWKAGQCPEVEISVRDGADETRARCRTGMSLVGAKRTNGTGLIMSVFEGKADLPVERPDFSL